MIVPQAARVGSITREEDAVNLYIQHIKSTVRMRWTE